MKISWALPALLILSLSSAQGASRSAQFWTEREKSLASEKETLRKADALDPALEAIIEREQSRAQSLSTGTEEKSDGKVINRKDAQAALATYLVRDMAVNLPSASEEKSAAALLQSEVEKRFTDKGITPDKKFIAGFMIRLSEQKRKILALECGIAARQNYFDTENARIADELIAVSQSSRSSGNAIMDYFRDNPVPHINAKEMTLDNSSVAKEFLRETDNYASILVSAKDFLGSKGSIADGYQIAQSVKKIDTLSKTSFARLSARLCDSEPFERNGDKNTLVIPREPDMSTVFSDIDSIRTDALSRISKGENLSDVRTRADKEMHDAIAKGVKDSADTFFKSEERMKILAGDDPESVPAPETKNPFYKSKVILRAKIRKAHEYRDASIRFIMLSAKVKGEKTDADLCVASYNELIQSFNRMLTSLDALERIARQTQDDHLRAMHGALIHKERAFLESLRALSAISESDRVVLKKDGVKIALDQRNELAKRIQSMIGMLRSPEKEKEVQKSVRNISLQQNDENALAESVRSWNAALAKLTHTDSLFSQYKSLFTQ
ncbi:MAG TPA: hypothetical protein VF857_01635, partial [Spirochaetota bacterium]